MRAWRAAQSTVGSISNLDGDVTCRAHAQLLCFAKDAKIKLNLNPDAAKLQEGYRHFANADVLQYSLSFLAPTLRRRSEWLASWYWKCSAQERRYIACEMIMKAGIGNKRERVSVERRKAKQ